MIEGGNSTSTIRLFFWIRVRCAYLITWGIDREKSVDNLLLSTLDAVIVFYSRDYSPAPPQVILFVFG